MWAGSDEAQVRRRSQTMDAIREMELNFKSFAAVAENTTTMVLTVSKAALSASAAQLVLIANQVAEMADDSLTSKVKLVRAADRLSQVEDSIKYDAVAELIFESAALAREAGKAGNEALMCSAMDLGKAGRSFLQVAALHKMDVAEQPNQGNQQMAQQPKQGNQQMAEQSNQGNQQMAKKQAEGRLGWMAQISSWWSRRKRMRDIESLTTPLLVPAASLASEYTATTIPQGQWRLCDKWLGMQTCVLAMSLSLLPYMGRDGILKKDLFSSNYLSGVDTLFKLWWGLVALGVPCSLYGRGWIAQQYARLSGHLAILGLTILVGMFSHWMLEIKATIVLIAFLGLTTLCCVTGDL